MADRAVSIDDNATIRFRAVRGHLSGHVRLPFDVLAGRTLAAEQPGEFDVTVSVIDFLNWMDSAGPEPSRRDAHWLSALPPRSGWERIETVPDGIIRELVRAGAQALRDTETRSAQQALLSSLALTAASRSRAVAVPLGPLSALTRMGFMPHGTAAAVDVSGGWTRIAATYGSTFVNSGSGALGLLGLQL